MTSINFRIYADQIWGFSQKYITEYISPEIEKEDFTTKFKSGKLSYDNLSTKKVIPINPQMSLDELNIQKIDVNIPNETENLSIFLNNAKAVISLSEISNDEIEKMIINERKGLIDKFMAFVIKKIEKKESSKSFIEGLIESFVNRAINGLSLDFNNIELILKFKKHIFTFMIEKISYSEEDGIKLNNVSLSLEEDSITNVIINKFSINIDINPDNKIKKIENEEKKEENLNNENNEENGNNENNVDDKVNKDENNNNNINKPNEENKKNKLYITMTNFEFELNQNIFYAINDIYDLFSSIEYQKVFLRYKKLIQFHKPKQSENIENNENVENNNDNIKHNYYISLWYYAIKTVIKLQKYIGHKKDYIFDLIESSQLKISKKYLENNSKIENILLPTEINLLKSTKEKVEKQLLENKKGGGLTKAFSFFFGGGGDDEKKELTEEEKNELNMIYTDDYIIKYLLGLTDNNTGSNNPLNEKIQKFTSDLLVMINVEKIELVLINLNERDNNNKCNLFIKDINLNFDLINKKYNFEMNINDIGSLLNESLFSDRIDDNYLIQVKKEQNNELIKLNLGFNNIVLNEEIFIFILTYFYSLKIPKKIKLFHNVDYSSKINKNENKEKEKEKEEENKQNENLIDNEENKDQDTLSILDNFSISHIPSLSLLNSDDNKIEFNLSNCSFTKNLLSFTINIQDSFGTILDNYSFNFHREQDGNKQKFKFHLEEPLNIILSKKSTFFLFVTYLKLKAISEKIIKNSKNKNAEEKDGVNVIDNKKEENINLFCFNYVEYKNVDIDFNNICLDIILSDVNIEMYEKKCSTSLSIKNFIIKYENKDMLFKTEKIEVNTDYLSTIILYILDFKSKDFDQYQKIIDNHLNISDNSINKEENELLIDDKENLNNEQINNITTNYNIKISDIISSLNLEIDIIICSIKIEDNIVFLNINNIKGNNNENEPNIICISMDDISFYIEKKNDLQEKYNVLNINKDILVNYYLDKDVFKVKVDSPVVNIFKSIFISIFKDIKYLNDQVNWDVIICKIEMEIINTSVRFSIFYITIDYIYMSNFDGKTTDNLFLKINKLLMRNEKNIKIIRLKELSAKSSKKSLLEDNINFKFDDIYINISQHDISFLLSLLESDEQEEQDLNNNNLYKINNMNLVSKNSESLVMFEGEKDRKRDNNKLDSDKNNKSEKENILQVEGEVNNFNVGFCLDDYTKKSDLNIGKIGLYLKNANIKNMERNQLDHLLEYKIGVANVLLKYFDDYKNEIIILNYNKEQKKGIIKHNPNTESNNQIEIISQKDIITININKNEIILRIDCFLLLYYFFMKALPKNKHNNENIISDFNSNNKNNTNQNLNIQINFNNTKFQLQTSFDAKENLNLNIDDFNISYNNNKDNLTINSNSQILNKNETYPTYINIKLGYISASIISEKQSRELFYSKKEFLLINCEINNNIIDLDINLGSLFINLSYQDIISFLKSYLLNKLLIQNIQSLSKLQSEIKVKNTILNTVGTIVENKKKSDIKAKLFFFKIDFTLADNSYGNYQPFLNGCLYKISLNLNGVKNVLTSFNLLLSSYNYISCEWEPILENLLINLKGEYLKNKIDVNVDISEIIMNLSDMAISSTLIILQHWLEQFVLDEKECVKVKIANNNVIQFNNEINKLTKITNNTIINYSGMNLIIKYNNNEFKCSEGSKLELEYINDWNISKLGPKKITVSINDKNNNNKNNEFNIYIEKLEVYEHYFENYNNFLIAENTLSKDRRIIISIYSPMIIKNKTFDNLQIKFINEELGNSFMLLKSNDIIGIPLKYYNNDTSFTINLINKHNLNDKSNQNLIKFNLKDFIESPNDNETLSIIPFEDKVFHMKLIKKLNNLKEILITFQYCIINCLPCELIIENQREKKSITIKKFNQHFIDFYSDPDTELKFKIKIGDEYFESVNTKYFKMTKINQSGNNYFTMFYNKNKTQSFKLSLQYNKSKNRNVLIIYSEYILYNECGIDFNIISKNENSPLCFNIGNQLYLISSQINDIKKVWIQLKNEKYTSNKITLDDIIEAKPYYNLKLENNEYKLDLIIRTNMSYISIRNNPNFKENIMTMIFKIYPICRVTNLLTSKNVLICEEKNKNNYIIIKTLKQINFNFFEKGKNIALSLGILNINDNKCSPLIQFKLTSFGIFSFCVENTLFNIEVKDSITGIIDIFIVETNIDNAKIIIENLSNNNFSIYQDGYEKFCHIISRNDKQILKIYDQNYRYFIIKNRENDKNYRFSFISFKEEEHIKEIDGIVFIKESNGMKMKLIILNKKDFQKINNTIMNFNVVIDIQKILISAIGDNEFKNKKLRNYQRNELLLLNLSKFKIEYKLEHHSGLINNDKVNIKIILDTFSLFNQISKYGKYSCVCKNITSPMSYIHTEIFNYKNSSMSKINKFMFQMAKLKLDIDPHFIEEVINFFENILYRMGIINFNVDEIFLHRNRDFKVRKQFENYQKENPICYGINISFPDIDINFELTEIGLGKLLSEKANCSNFFVWLGYGLVGKEQNIFLKKPIINSHLGSFNSLIQKILIIYKDEASSEIINIGLKGLWGQIQQFFVNPNKTSKDCLEVQKNRIRPPRALYGKYKYFKNYNKDDAKYFYNLENKYQFEKNGCYIYELIKGKKNIYIFTNTFFFVFTDVTYDLCSKVEYASIDKIIVDQVNLVIYFNSEGKKKNNTNSLSIFCEMNSIVENIEKTLNEKYMNKNN